MGGSNEVKTLPVEQRITFTRGCPTRRAVPAFESAALVGTSVTIDEQGHLITPALSVADFVFPTSDGIAGQTFITDGAGYLTWGTPSGGDVIGPGSATNNALARFNGTTGALIKNSTVTVDDAGNIADAASVNAAAVATDTITSLTPDAGVFVESVLLKDAIVDAAAVNTDTITELTPDAGVSVEGILLKDAIVDAAAVNTDTITELTPDAGVSVEGVLLKDSAIATDTITELTPDAGVSVEGVLLKDSAIATDTITELTPDAGVSVEGVLLKDSVIATDTITELTPDAGVSVEGILLKDSAIATDTITELTPDAGVSVEGVLLKDAIVDAAAINTDTITELTPDAGVSVEGVLLKDSAIATDTITELTPDAGVSVENVLLKDAIIDAAAVNTDTITELTPDAGVSVEGVLLKDSEISLSVGAGLVKKVLGGPTIDNNLQDPFFYMNFNADDFTSIVGPAGVKEGTGGVFVDGKAVTPALGRAYNNEGTARVEIPGLSALLGGLTTWTLGVWVNVNVLTGVDRYLICKQVGAPQEFTLTLLSGGNLRWQSNGVSIEGPTVLSTGTWYWVCVIQNGTTTTMYLDNVFQGDDPSALPLNGNIPREVTLFAREGGGFTCNAILDEIWIASVAISETQRNAMYVNGGKGDGNPSIPNFIPRWDGGLGKNLKMSSLQIDDGGVLLPFADDAQDIGSATKRFSDIYATNATIQTSDVNMKRDIVGLGSLVPNPAAFLLSLRPVIYKWKDFTYTDLEGNEQTKTHTRNHFGMIAQEVEAALDAHGIDKNEFAAWTQDAATGRQGLRYGEFVPILIKAVQELILTVQSLEARIAALEVPVKTKKK